MIKKKSVKWLLLVVFSLACGAESGDGSTASAVAEGSEQSGTQASNVLRRSAKTLPAGDAQVALAQSPEEPGLAPLLALGPKAEAIEGEYIVVLKKTGMAAAQSRAAVTSVAAAAGVQPQRTYHSAIQGFAVKLSAKQLRALRRDSRVEYIEPNQRVSVKGVQYNPTWGLDRIDEQYSPYDSQYSYTTMASNVHAYVIDTGIESGNWDFGGRVSSVYYDVIGDGYNGEDCHGHGTHVAGTVGGGEYGVAKGVQLHAVRVLGCDGFGTSAGIIQALDWLIVNAQRPAVANMSLGGDYSAAENDAVTALSNSGVFVAVAAGNENWDACSTSPASAAGAFTVAASDYWDYRASFSNYGGCVDLYAPGVDITSDYPGGSIVTMSGTSMATPHVAGVAALYKGSMGDAASSTIKSWLITNSTQNMIGGNISGTPNLLLYKSNL